MIDIKALKISDTDYYDASIERLGNEANNPNEYAIKRLSARELKRRFMAPSDLLKVHFNLLCDLLVGMNEDGALTPDSLAGLIKTGIPSHPTLYDLFVGFGEGTIPDAIVMGEGETLSSLLEKILWQVKDHGEALEEIDKAMSALDEFFEKVENGDFNGFSPIVTVTPGELEDTVTITDEEGEKHFAVPKDASKIFFPEDVKTAYPVGNITLTNGVGVMAKKGESVADLFRNVWFKIVQPTVTQPSLTVSFSGAAKEVGSTIKPSYYATFTGGKYSFGPTTGVAATAWRISDTEGNSSSDMMGTYDVQLTDETAYQLTVEVDHSAGVVPYTNEGKESEEVSGIEAGTVTWTSPAIKGFRNTFYGAFTQADLDAFAGMTQSQIIRTLTKSGKALANGNSFTVDIPVGAKQVVIAYPATLRDVSSIKDVNGMGAQIKSSFVLYTADVEGANGYTAISYKVYVLEYAEAVETANTYTVVI